ncbi:hypothetical protein BSKO_08469 [Bryopsis sp. KO-2023]|nr:hypothetical protein BSKO_08469 [Bryopsis sp. KO-2023]
MVGSSRIKLVDYVNLLKRNRLYRLLCMSEGINNIGEWLTLVATIEVGKRMANGGGTIVSTIYALRRIPSIVLFPITGVMADMHDRGKILVASLALDAVVVAILPFTEMTRNIWCFYGIVLLQFTIAAFLTPARNALAPMIVPIQDMQLQATLDSIMWAAIGALGACIGGFATALLGTTFCFQLDSATYIVGALLSVNLIGLPFKPTTPIPALPEKKAVPSFAAMNSFGGPIDGLHHEVLIFEKNWGTENLFVKPAQHRFPSFLSFMIRVFLECGATFGDGLRYIVKRENRHVAFLAMIKGCGSLIWGVADILYVQLAEHPNLQVFGGTSSTIGLFYGVSCLGSIVGPLVSNSFTSASPKALLDWIGISFLLMGLSYTLMCLNSGLLMLLFTIVMRAAGGEILYTYSSTLLQIEVESDMRGRVAALEDVFCSLCGVGSAVFIGVASDRLGLSERHAVVVMALISYWFASQCWALSVRYQKRFKMTENIASE